MAPAAVAPSSAPCATLWDHLNHQLAGCSLHGRALEADGAAAAAGPRMAARSVRECQLLDDFAVMVQLLMGGSRCSSTWTDSRQLLPIAASVLRHSLNRLGFPFDKAAARDAEEAFQDMVLRRIKASVRLERRPPSQRRFLSLAKRQRAKGVGEPMRAPAAHPGLDQAELRLLLRSGVDEVHGLAHAHHHTRTRGVWQMGAFAIDIHQGPPVSSGLRATSVSAE
ncbi:MAG: hypothetical protein BJ554DRAFT_598 [Olpidium bornovanus]|uniref:Uncharacterized protein n=1 Tax=Olpidium bornovanus TaxID=278681 RepID=A0A8H7ZTB1_9FUNG|nr:MAG: hypothetical protein BJ554DRAFT_598 [Olpidium bornovanus]